MKTIEIYGGYKAIVDDEDYDNLKEFQHRTTFSIGKNDPVTERLYGNKIAYEIIQKALNKNNAENNIGD